MIFISIHLTEKDLATTFLSVKETIRVGFTGRRAQFRVVKEHICSRAGRAVGRETRILRLTDLVYPGGIRVARGIVSVAKRK